MINMKYEIKKRKSITQNNNNETLSDIDINRKIAKASCNHMNYEVNV